MQQRDAAALGGDQHVARAHLGDPVEGEQEVLVVVELLADERLGLGLVRRDEERLGLDARSQRLALGVEHDRDVAPLELAGRLGVEVVGDVTGQRAGKDDELRSLRQVAQLLEQRLELLGRDRRPPLVDLGVGAAGGIDDRRRRARLAVDAHEVVEDRLARQLLDDARPGRAADQAGGDDGDAERLQRARDVDAFAARPSSRPRSRDAAARAGSSARSACGRSPR